MVKSARAVPFSTGTVRLCPAREKVTSAFSAGPSTQASAVTAAVRAARSTTGVIFSPGPPW